jgi:hypothetical protein
VAIGLELLEWLKGLRLREDGDESVTDGRILGGETFARSLIRQKKRSPDTGAKSPEELIRDACGQSGLSVNALQSGSRRANVARLRASLVLQLVDHPGMTLTGIALLVGVSKSGVYKILERKA